MEIIKLFHFFSDTPLTTIALASDTTKTSPVGTSGTIDVATEAMHTGANLNDEVDENDEMESDEAEETVEPQTDIPMKVAIASKPETSTDKTPPHSNENKILQPSAQSSTPIEAPVHVANKKPQVPLQIPIAVTSPVKPINGNRGSQKPNSNNEAQPTYGLGQRPQFPFAPPYIPNNFYANQQSPNSGIQTPFKSPFTSFGNYPANPGFGYNPNFGFNPNVASNGAQSNAPNSAPNSAQNVQPFAAPNFGAFQSQFVPQNFYNKPTVAPNIQVSNAPNEDKADTEDSSSEEAEDDNGGDNDEDEPKSEEYESNSSEEPQQQNTQTAPARKTENVQTANIDDSGNKLPPNYQAYFNFLNQFKQNQGNPNQASANRIGSNQYSPQPVNQHQYNSQPVHQYQYQFNPNQASHALSSNQFHQHFQNTQFNPNQLNLPHNPNHYYYPNNFNAPNINGFPPQFTAPNAQYSQYNPYNNPFYTQSVNAFLNQANANFGHFPKPSNSYSTPNRPFITNQVNQAAANEKNPSTVNQFYTNNRKVRPNSDQKEGEESVKPENKPQNSVVIKEPNVPDSNNENIQIQKNEEDSVS